MHTITNIYKVLIRAIAGHEFYVWHIDTMGRSKVFPCTTMQDAMEWASCALNEDQVKIVDRSGYLVASRARIKA